MSAPGPDYRNGQEPVELDRNYELVQDIPSVRSSLGCFSVCEVGPCWLGAAVEAGSAAVDELSLGGLTDCVASAFARWGYLRAAEPAARAAFDPELPITLARRRFYFGVVAMKMEAPGRTEQWLYTSKLRKLEISMSSSGLGMQVESTRSTGQWH